MKIKLITFLSIVFITKLFGQEGFNYQAILYDDNGAIVINRTVDIRLTISGETQPSPSLANAYVETHTVQIGEDGVINVVIGNGIVESALTLNEIDWGNPPLYIQREVNFGQGFQILGYSQVLSVPIAEYSKKSGALSLFDSRTNVIENAIDPKAPSLEMSPSGVPTSTLELGSLYSSNNVMLGKGSGNNLTLGYDNIGIGNSALASVTSSYGNIAMGRNSLRFLTAAQTSGVYNIALGYRSLENLTSGWVNIGIGSTSLMDLTSGSHNVAMGAGALERLTEGFGNTGLGGDALNRMVLGSRNTAIGYEALRFSNSTGTVTATLGDFSYKASIANTAVGNGAMKNNALGSFNIAFGQSALENNNVGFNNSAIGMYSLQNNTDGVDNTALGWGALMNSENSNGNTALGGHSGQYLADASNNNTFIGNYSGVTEVNSTTQIENAIAIGAQATVAASNTIQLGNSSIVLVETSGVVSATKFRGDGSELTNLGALSLFDSRTNVIENAIDPKAPSLEMSPSGVPTSTLELGSLYSSNNVMLGKGSGNNLTLGYDNIGIGNSALASVTSSYGNIAMGRNSLRFLTAAQTSGVYNIALGYRSLENLTSGWVNIGIGSTSLMDLTSGSHNVAMGAGALERLTEGFGNTGLGGDALNRMVLGSRNTAIGYEALRFSNSTGTVTATLGDFSYKASIANTAVGNGAMKNNALGSFNIAFGQSALENNNVGFNNSAIGMYSLQNNTDGVDNTALGWGALMNSENSNGNTALGGHSGQYLADASNNNTFIGNYSGVTEVNSTTQIENAIAIGAQATVAASNTFVLGSSSVSHWSFGRTKNDSGKVIQVGDNNSNGNGAYLSAGGVWTNASSIAFKTSISTLSSQHVLSLLNKLMIKKWRYKGTEEYHIGPFAEQFNALFNLGVKEDKEHISAMDLAGISLLGIQEQSKHIEKLQNENQQLIKENNKLKDNLEQLLNRLILVEKKINDMD